MQEPPRRRCYRVGEGNHTPFKLKARYTFGIAFEHLNLLALPLIEEIVATYPIVDISLRYYNEKVHWEEIGHFTEIVSQILKCFVDNLLLLGCPHQLEDANEGLYDYGNADHFYQGHDPLILVESELFIAWLFFVPTSEVLSEVSWPGAGWLAYTVQNTYGSLTGVVISLFGLNVLQAALGLNLDNFFLSFGLKVFKI